MSEAKEIVLFDLPSKGRCAAWTPNPWKTRLILNYKHIPYTTYWLEYPDVEPHLKSLGIPPNPPEAGILSDYSVPTIRLPDGTCIMDSKKIAAALEERYPDPPLHLDAPELAKAEDLLGGVLRALATTLLPKVPRTLLNESSRVYFNETREQRFGMPMEQLEREKGGEENWVAARPVVEQIGEFLRAKGGPFILGKEVSYADFYLIGALHFFKRMGEGVYERFVEMAPELGKLYEASKELLVKDD